MVRNGIYLNTDDILQFCQHWKIKSIDLFGSILRDDFGPNSDIDFLVVWDDDADWDLCDHIDMEIELSSILGRKVDIVSRQLIETSENRFRKRAILSTAEPLIAR